MSTTTIELVEAVADETRARPLFGAPEGAGTSAAVTNGFTYRHAWAQQHKGRVDLKLNGFFGIEPDWQVFGRLYIPAPRHGRQCHGFSLVEQQHSRDQ